MLHDSLKSDAIGINIDQINSRKIKTLIQLIVSKGGNSVFFCCC